jgi:acetylornithine deacetylase/succinyl-diaminopimelate desuccinylase-like protein
MPANSSAVELLAELVRIPSVNPPGDGEGAVAEVLREPLAKAGFDTDILTSPSGRPSLVARLPGSFEDRPPLVMLSHADVVPVEERSWTRDPFGGEVVDGALWGRGTLDMKGVAVLHVEAAIALTALDRQPARDVVVVCVADEEAGGAEGAEWLLRDHPASVGFRDWAPPPEVLGEGAFGLSGVLPRPIMPIVLGEKSPLWLRAHATGAPGHGSLPPPSQAIRNLARFVEAVSGPRPAHLHPVMREQFEALATAAAGAQGRLFALLAGPADPTAIRALAPILRTRAGVIGHLVADTVTPTMLSGGYKFNVVPGEAEVAFDARLLPDTDPDRVLEAMRRVGRRHDVDLEEVHRWSSPTSGRGRLFELLAEVSTARVPAGAHPAEVAAPIAVPSLTPAMTDLRFFRAHGATAYGWVPLVLTPELFATFHGHDERVPLDEFELALDAMTDVVRLATSGA